MRPALLTAIAAAIVLAVSAPSPARADGRKHQKADKDRGKAASGSSTTKWNASASGGGVRMPDGPMRIAFGPGTMSASLIGECAKGERREFLLAGRSGQSVSLRILGPRGARPSFEVASPGTAALPSPVSRKVYDGSDRPHASTWVLEADGDYVISVTVLDERISRFTLTIDVR